MANLDDVGNPKYRMEQEVMQKHFGIGKVDKVIISEDGIKYHVKFNNGIQATIPECDLQKAPKVKQ